MMYNCWSIPSQVCPTNNDNCTSSQSKKNAQHRVCFKLFNCIPNFMIISGKDDVNAPHEDDEQTQKRFCYDPSCGSKICACGWLGLHQKKLMIFLLLLAIFTFAGFNKFLKRDWKVITSAHFVNVD